MTTTSFNISDHKLLDGRQYTISQNTDLAQDATTNLLVQNPENSGAELILFFGEVTHEGETECVVYEDVSGISGGSTEDIAADNIGASETPSATSQTDITFTPNGDHHRVVYTGTGVRGLFNGYKIVIQPGHNILVELTNPNQNNDQVGIRMTWVEKPN